MDFGIIIVIYSFGLLPAIVFSIIFEDKLNIHKAMFIIFSWPVAMVILLLIGFVQIIGIPAIYKRIMAYYETKHNMNFVSSIASKSDIHQSAILAAMKISDNNKAMIDANNTSNCILKSLKEDPNLDLTEDQWKNIEKLLTL